MTDTKNYLIHACGGTWESLPRWSSRYRCNKCGAFGYRNAAAPISVCDERGKFIGAKENIKEYRCRTKDCNAFAVAKDNGNWRCRNHRKKRK